MANAWRSERLIYRALEPEDDEFLSEVSANPRTFLNAVSLMPTPQTKAGAKYYRDELTKSLLGVMICIAPSPESVASSNPPKPTPIGQISLHTDGPVRAQHRCASLSITIHEPFQAKGYGGEAIKWALYWGFQRANLHRIELSAFEWNTPALKLYERLGFVVEARKRERVWFDGKFWDDIEFSMLDREWRARYQPEQGLEQKVVA